MLPDERMRMHAARRGYRLTHLSRPVCTDDFYNFDLILGMDDRNIANLRDMAPDIESEKKIGRMTDYCRTKVVDYVPDPYYGGAGTRLRECIGYTGRCLSGVVGRD